MLVNVLVVLDVLGLSVTLITKLLPFAVIGIASVTFMIAAVMLMMTLGILVIA